MNLKNKALSMIGIAAMSFGITGGVALADLNDSDGSIATLPVAACVYDASVDADDLAFAQADYNSTSVTSTSALDVTVDTGCILEAWSVDIDAGDFTATVFGYPHTVESSLMTLTGNNDKEYVPFPGYEAVAPGLLDPALTPGITQASSVTFDAAGEGSPFALVASTHLGGGNYVGAPGTTTASFNGAINGLTGLVPGATYQSNLTVTLAPNP